MPIRRLLFPTDFSEPADLALHHALFLAERLHATLHVLYVTEDAGAEAVAQGRAELESYFETHDIHGVATDRAVVAAEAPAPPILAYAEAQRIDLIVMGTHGRRGLQRLFLGSVAEEVIRQAPCPVLAVRAEDRAFPRESFGPVLAPLDLSKTGLRALPTAKELAAAYGAPLHLLHVLVDLDLPGIYGDVVNPIYDAYPEIQERAQAEMERAAAEAEGPEVPVELHFERGFAAEAIVDYATQQGAGLVVLARHGYRGLTRFLIGSIAEKVVRTAPCPVLVVPVPTDWDEA